MSGLLARTYANGRAGGPSPVLDLREAGEAAAQERETTPCVGKSSRIHARPAVTMQRFDVIVGSRLKA